MTDLVTEAFDTLISEARDTQHEGFPSLHDGRSPDTDGGGNAPGVVTPVVSLSSDEMAEEVRILPTNPDDAWSIEGSRWLRGQREGLTMAGVLKAERDARLGFSRPEAFRLMKEKFSKMGG